MSNVLNRIKQLEVQKKTEMADNNTPERGLERIEEKFGKLDLDILKEVLIQSFRADGTTQYIANEIENAKHLELSEVLEVLCDDADNFKNVSEVELFIVKNKLDATLDCKDIIARHNAANGEMITFNPEAEMITAENREKRMEMGLIIDMYLKVLKNSSVRKDFIGKNPYAWMANKLDGIEIKEDNEIIIPEVVIENEITPTQTNTSVRFMGFGKRLLSGIGNAAVSIKSVITCDVSRSLKIYNNNATKSLIEAVKNGDIEEVKKQLANRADPNEGSNYENNNALHFAAEYGHIEIMKLLINNGADINKINKYERTPIFIAAYNGQAGAVKLLLEKGANTEIKNISGNTPLDVAAHCKHNEVVEILFENKINSDHRGCYCNGYREAMENNRNEIIEIFFEHNHIHDYINKENPFVIKLLEKKGRTSELFKAIEKNDIIDATFLVKKGVFFKHTNKVGLTSYDLAVKFDRTEIAALIKDAMEKDARNKTAKRKKYIEEKKQTATNELFLSINNPWIDDVISRISDGADVNAQDEDGNTPLLIASTEGKADFAKVLLIHNADVTIKNNDGQTALSRAEFYGHTEVVDLIQQHMEKQKAGKPTLSAKEIVAITMQQNNVAKQMV